MKKNLEIALLIISLLLVIAVFSTPVSRNVLVRILWYYPEKQDGLMANGERWQDNLDVALACPPELPFGTILTIDGKEWICKDRGIWTTYDKETGIYNIDMLTNNPLYEDFEVKTAVVRYP